MTSDNRQQLFEQTRAIAKAAGYTGDNPVTEYVIHAIPWTHHEGTRYSQYTVSGADLSTEQHTVMTAVQEMQQVKSSGTAQYKEYYALPALEAAIASAKGHRIVPLTERPLPDYPEYAAQTKRALDIEVDLSTNPHQTLLQEALSIAAKAGYRKQSTHTHDNLVEEWENVYRSLPYRGYAPLIDYAVRTLPWEPTHTGKTMTAVMLPADKLTPEQKTVLDALVQSNLMYHPADKEHASDYLPRPPMEKVVLRTRVKSEGTFAREELAKRWCRHHGYRSIEEYATFELPWKGTHKNPAHKIIEFDKLNVDQLEIFYCLQKRGKVIPTDEQEKFFIPGESFHREMLDIAHDKLVSSVITHLDRF